LPHFLKALSTVSTVRLRVSFFHVVGFLFALSANASSLTWEKTVVEIQAPPLAENVDAVFRFTNTGKSRVSIVNAAASCGCTVPQIGKVTYEPGEKGEVHALFTPDDRVGLRQEEVMVLTDEPGQAPQALVLRVNIPKLYEVAPYFVMWHGGDAPAQKKIKIHFLDPKLLTPIAITALDPRIAVSLEKNLSSRGDYTVLVRPTSTASPLDTRIVVDLSGPNGAKRSLNLYAVIRTAAATPPEAAH
jgi:hypothetical protein